MTNDLHRALGDIRDIRRQVAQSTEFRGYGPMTLASTALVALVAALVQARWVGDPVVHPVEYTTVWGATTLLSAALILTQTLTRAHRLHSGMADEMIRMALEQFLPALIAGALLTAVLLRSAPEALWMLPGLWQIVYALGIFSSCRFLPRLMLAAGAWYLLTGLGSLGFGDARAMSPWVMATACVVGQSMIAVVLYTSAKQREVQA